MSGFAALYPTYLLDAVLMVIELKGKSGALRHGEPSVYVHSSVKNADNFYRLGKCLTVKNHMAARVEFTVTVPNIATVLSNVGIRSQLMKTGIHHG